MTKKNFKLIFASIVVGAFLGIVVGGTRSLVASYTFEFSRGITWLYLIEWSLVGAGLGLLFAPLVTPARLPLPRVIQTLGGTTSGLAAALMSYGDWVSATIGAIVGALIGFLAPYWTPYSR